MQARLALVSPAAAAREFKISLPTTIGRSRDAKLKLVHGQVSRLHCEIFERDGLLYVRDLGSTNGTFVNDERVTDDLLLPPGGSLMLGTVELRALYGDAADDLLPPGMFTATETVRAVPQDDTFRVTDPDQLSEAKLAESPFGFTEFEAFADDIDLPQSTDASNPAHSNPTDNAPATGVPSEFDWLSESELSPTGPEQAASPIPAPQAPIPPTVVPPIKSTATKPPTAKLPPDLQPPAEYLTPIEAFESPENRTIDDWTAEPADFGAPNANADFDNAIAANLNDAGQHDASQNDAGEVELLPLDESLADQGQPSKEAPNYFPQDQADPTPLDDKHWRVPEDLSVPFPEAAPKAAAGQRVAPPAKAPAVPPAVAVPAAPVPTPIPPAKSPAPVDDDLENFFNSFQ